MWPGQGPGARWRTLHSCLVTAISRWRSARTSTATSVTDIWSIQHLPRHITNAHFDLHNDNNIVITKDRTMIYYLIFSWQFKFIYGTSLSGPKLFTCTKLALSICSTFYFPIFSSTFETWQLPTTTLGSVWLSINLNPKQVIMDRKRAYQTNMKQRFDRCKTPMGSVPISVIMGFDYPLGVKCLSVYTEI